MNWVTLAGKWRVEDGGNVVFIGGEQQTPQGAMAEAGVIVSDEFFGGGTITAQVEFKAPSVAGAAVGLVLYYNPQTGAFIAAQLGGLNLTSLQIWTGTIWQVPPVAGRGPSDQLRPNKVYSLSVKAIGSRVVFNIDGVELLATNVPYPIPRGQVGIWATGRTNEIVVSNLVVSPEKPKLFVVMQFTPPYNELYTDVILPLGKKLGFDVLRADEFYGPGLIINDIERQVVEAKAIIAEISPNNANVYWEVGYAHALKKPTVLIADRETKLPFDVSSFRVLFYENTIGGKKRIEEGLINHLTAIQTEWQG